MEAPPPPPLTGHPPAANPPTVLALVPMAPQNQVKNGFHTKTWGDGSKCVARRPPPPAARRVNAPMCARCLSRLRVLPSPFAQPLTLRVAAPFSIGPGTKASGWTTK